MIFDWFSTILLELWHFYGFFNEIWMNLWWFLIDFRRFYLNFDIFMEILVSFSRFLSILIRFRHYLTFLWSFSKIYCKFWGIFPIFEIFRWFRLNFDIFMQFSTQFWWFSINFRWLFLNFDIFFLVSCQFWLDFDIIGDVYGHFRDFYFKSLWIFPIFLKFVDDSECNFDDFRLIFDDSTWISTFFLVPCQFWSDFDIFGHSEQPIRSAGRLSIAGQQVRIRF